MPNRSDRRAAERAQRSTTVTSPPSLLSKAKAQASPIFHGKATPCTFAFAFVGIMQNVLVLLHNDGTSKEAIERYNNLLNDKKALRTLLWGGEMIAEIICTHTEQKASITEVQEALTFSVSSIFTEQKVIDLLPDWFDHVRRDTMIDLMTTCLYSAIEARRTSRISTYAGSIRKVILPAFRATAMQHGLIDMIGLNPDRMPVERMSNLCIALIADTEKEAGMSGTKALQEVERNITMILDELEAILKDTPGPREANILVLTCIAFGGMLLPLLHLALYKKR